MISSYATDRGWEGELHLAMNPSQLVPSSAVYSPIMNVSRRRGMANLLAPPSRVLRGEL